MTSLMVWGRGDHGQLGLGGGLEEPLVTSPSPVSHLPWTTDVTEDGEDVPDSAALVAGGDRHTVVVSRRGRMYVCGNNDFSQLGHDKNQTRFEKVDALDTYVVVAAACGQNHTLALDEWGKVFSWGDDSVGQAGHNTGASKVPVPRMIRGLGTVSVVQIACGSSHSLVLTDSGRLFSFGSNSNGQLGLGDSVGNRTLTPQPVESLAGLPVASIACGGFHSVVVSVSGAVYAWGKNSFGQLGIGSQDDRNFPTQVKSLRNQDVRRVCCGLEHTVCLTADGGVFSFGGGGYGQLGHGGRSNEKLPKKILELMGTEVTQVACGKLHTLALVPSRGRLYSFGLGGAGQLGNNCKLNAAAPQIVLGPWVNSRGESVMPSSDDGRSQYLYVIGAGGDQSFAGLNPVPSGHAASGPSPPDQREGDRGIRTLTRSLADRILSTGADDPLDQDFLEEVETVFQSRACLNGSLLVEGGPSSASHRPCTSRNSGIDFASWTSAFSAVRECQNDTLRDAVHSSITTSVVPALASVPPDVETLRSFLVLPLYHRFADPTAEDELQTPFSHSLISLAKNPWTVVERWLAERDADYLRGLVVNLKSVVVHLLKKKKSNGGHGFKHQLESNLTLLRILNRINVEKDLIIDYEDFYVPEVNDLIDLADSYGRWLMEKTQQPPGAAGAAVAGGEFHICNYPFVFDAPAKTRLLEVDQAIQMYYARMKAQNQMAFNLAFHPDMLHDGSVQYLVLVVDRDNLLRDTLVQVQQVTADDLKKPLRVQFAGEEAEDAGGVRKEFFLLLMRELLDPKFGMFKEYPETRTIWFHPMCFEEDVMFFLIGVICGLAIYNFSIINLPFPLMLYKSLLGGKIGTVEDLEELSPTTARSLRQVLEYDGDDFEDTFGLTFSLTQDCYGEVQTVELKDGGESAPVTMQNREEYARLYADYVINRSVARKTEAFHKGFLKVCGGRVLDLFHARELMALVVGNENYNWRELEESARYKEGYTRDHPTVRHFWSVFHEDLTEEERRRFLLFLTGCDRIPILGMASLNMHIQKTGDTNYLPVAHTCFNLLDLPEYATRERLKYKLLKAIQQTEGFGLA